MTCNAPQRVAIIGTGLAGLTVAYLLHNDKERRYVVTLLEQVCKHCGQYCAAS